MSAWDGCAGAGEKHATEEAGSRRGQRVDAQGGSALALADALASPGWSIVRELRRPHVYGLTPWITGGFPMLCCH